jgi:quinol monooxygenase YgiN
MFIVHLHVRVKPECVEAFRHATIAYAQESIQEAGMARLDVVQQLNDVTRFTLVEICYHEAAAAAHNETGHYNKWRDIIRTMTAEPVLTVPFTNVFPGSTGW